MDDVQSVSDLARALSQAKREMEDAQEALVDAAHVAAEKERDYRRQKAVEWTRSRGDTVKAREMETEGRTVDAKYEAKLAEDLRVAALERVRSARAIFSGVQTLTNAWREEVAFARGGGVEG